jgi:L-ascorbate metabolism protein UlaG (beta-lactamase superfamily)
LRRIRLIKGEEMKFIGKYTFLFVLILYFVKFSGTQSNFEAVERGDSNRISEIQLNHGEAAVWYLFHAGWAIKTSSTFMIFDYLVEIGSPELSSLTNGIINPDEIKDQNVYVFISHSHGDHFDRNVLKWNNVIPNITYVLGWEAKEAQSNFSFGEERSSKSIGPMQVKNIFHDFDNIPESAFLIEVDGLNIYFSGDHGNSAGALNPIYKDNIDYMSRQSYVFDLVFLSIFGSPTYDGEFYAVDKFKPRVILPMHYGGRESDAESFVTLARSKFLETEFWHPMKKGDRFLYKKGKVLPLK